MTRIRTLAIGATVAAGLLAWLFRFDLVVGEGDRGPIAYRLDRWTGTVAACFSINPCQISPVERR